MSVCSGLSSVVCSDESAHGQLSAGACYFGRANAELFGEFGHASVAAFKQSEEHSHLYGGVLAMLKQPEYSVECCLRLGHRLVSEAGASACCSGVMSLVRSFGGWAWWG